ncbi:MAG: hypothetical protein FJX74_10945, partial [Armatimonadetes bacterium]|nr:hypothetical protein [Armatimonadota bacterium]
MPIAFASWLTLAPVVHAGPPVQLDPLYFERCRRPCEYVGFSFAEDAAAMREMREHGANAVGTGSMWVPTDDPAAPDGCGVPDLAYLDDVPQLGQSFTADRPFTGVAFCTPTFNTEGSGCTLSLYPAAPEVWGDEQPARLATETFPDVRDNQQLWLAFDALPPGTYYLEQSAPTGDGIGVWAVGRNAYDGGRAYVARRAITADDFELRLRTVDGEAALIPPGESHHALRLGSGAVTQIGERGLFFDYAV